MFKSFKIINYNSYEIIDTDFGTIESMNGSLYYGICYSVIKEYEKRALNVAKNLVLLASYLSDQHGVFASIIIENWTKTNPDFNRYKDETLKYLILME